MIAINWNILPWFYICSHWLLSRWKLTFSMTSYTTFIHCHFHNLGVHPRFSGKGNKTGNGQGVDSMELRGTLFEFFFFKKINTKKFIFLVQEWQAESACHSPTSAALCRFLICWFFLRSDDVLLEGLIDYHCKYKKRFVHIILMLRFLNW